VVVVVAIMVVVIVIMVVIVIPIMTVVAVMLDINGVGAAFVPAGRRRNCEQQGHCREGPPHGVPWSNRHACEDSFECLGVGADARGLCQVARRTRRLYGLRPRSATSGPRAAPLS
jgi:hypothetical protein